MLYMNVLLRATVCDNLNEKIITGVWSQCQLPFKHRYAALPVPHHPHTACDYLHPFEVIETQVREINRWLLKGQFTKDSLCTWLSGGGERLKNQEIQKIYFKASLIKKNFKKWKGEKKINKECSPDITVLKQWSSHCLIYWNFLFCPWGEISRRPPVWSWMLEVCSWAGALSGWDRR